MKYGDKGVCAFCVCICVHKREREREKEKWDLDCFALATPRLYELKRFASKLFPSFLILTKNLRNGSFLPMASIFCPFILHSYMKVLGCRLLDCNWHSRIMVMGISLWINGAFAIHHILSSVQKRTREEWKEGTRLFWKGGIGEAQIMVKTEASIPPVSSPTGRHGYGGHSGHCPCAHFDEVWLIGCGQCKRRMGCGWICGCWPFDHPLCIWGSICRQKGRKRNCLFS